MTSVKPPTKFNIYLSFALTLIVLTSLIAFTAREIFSAMKTANEIDETLLQSVTPRINQQSLDAAFRAISTKKAATLDSL